MLGCNGSYTWTLLGGTLNVNAPGGLVTMGVMAGTAANPTYIGNGTLNLGPAPGNAAGAVGTYNGQVIVFGAGNSTINFNHTDFTGQYIFNPNISGPATGGTATVSLLSGYTVFTGTDTYTTTTGTRIASTATLQIGDGANGSVTDDLVDNGAVIFNLASNTSYSGDISGAGTLTQQGASTLTATSGAGVLTLSGANTYSGATTVSAGTLQAGVADTFSANSVVTVDSGATLELDGYSQSVAGVVLPATDSTVSLSTPTTGVTPATTLTTSGDWSGGGLVDMSTTLNGTNTSPTDLLVIGGNVTGTTVLHITNVDGLGAKTTGDGILIVQVAGDSPADGFVLDTADGKTISVGGFTYTLTQVGLNWYLQNPTVILPNSGSGADAVPLDARWMLALIGALLAISGAGIVRKTRRR